MEPRSPSDADVQRLSDLLAKPNKPQLQALCTVNGLPKTGNKADLQARINQLIKEYARTQDTQRFNEIRQSIYKYAGTPAYAMAPTAPTYYPTTPQTPVAQSPAARQPYAAPAPSYPPTAYVMANGQQRPQGNVLPLPHTGPSLSLAQRTNPATPATPGFQYKTSPFYEMRFRLGDVKTCEIMANHRNSVSFVIKAAEILHCHADSSLRVMVFCAGGNTGNQDIAFPHQSELKVNGGEIKANLRGLKNKPGSTRPVDITDSLRFRPHTYSNQIEFTYALTHKKFYICIILCKAMTVEALVNKIQKKIKKESVIAELTKKANDPDIEATSLNLSLKCPLSYMRLSRPCRGVSCSHIQCFDATSYLQLQEQGPQWLCPVCNKPAPFESLAIDEYVREILTTTPDTVEQVTIDPFGKWSIPGEKKEVKPTPAPATFSLDDDDVIISSFGNGNSYGINTATPNRIFAPAVSSAVGTPNTGTSRDSSAAVRSGSKRPAPEVIDLTLSDDEDDGSRPIKRPNLGYHGYHNGTY